MMSEGKLSPMETRMLLQDRVETAGHYFENGSALLLKGEDRKAAELLWGAAALMVKAVGLTEGKDIRGHYAIGKFVKTELGPRDPSLYERFLHIQSLHNHFYDRQFDRDDVEQILGEVLSFIEDLRTILDEVVGPPPGPPEEKPPMKA